MCVFLEQGLVQGPDDERTANNPLLTSLSKGNDQSQHPAQHNPVELLAPMWYAMSRLDVKTHLSKDLLWKTFYYVLQQIRYPASRLQTC